MTPNQLLQEILEQPEALRRIYSGYIVRKNEALGKAVDLLQKSQLIIFAGMVTSEYANYVASSHLNRHGKLNFVYDVSELLYYHLPALLNPGTCLVLVSQSGNSAEIVHIINELKERTPIIGIYNDENSFLATHCQIGLPICAGPQLACGSKTNLASMAVLLLLAATTLGWDFRSVGDQLLSVADSIEQYLVDWEQRVSHTLKFFEGAAYTIFLGRGPGRVSAMFSAAYFREVPKIPAEGMSAAAFRHGLLEMINPEHRAVIFAPQGETCSLMFNLAQNLLALHVPVMVITNTDTFLENAAFVRTQPFQEIVTPLFDIVPLQLAGYLLAQQRGIEPGKLVLCNYVTIVE